MSLSSPAFNYCVVCKSICLNVPMCLHCAGESRECERGARRNSDRLPGQTAAAQGTLQPDNDRRAAD